VTAGWPFWTPTPHERIEQALDLAQLRTGERFVDLGCGDGRVLLAAANRGAVVTGVELDADLAGKARRLLALAQVPGAVVEEDFAAYDLAADVVFAFLSPATLQRLVPRLQQLAPDARVVTTGFGVPGWEPEQVADRCFLYRIPPRTSPAADAHGWASAGVVVGLRAGKPSLVSVQLHHPSGRVVVHADEALARAVKLLPGADMLASPGTVVVDLRWAGLPAGTVVTGEIECAGVGSLAVFAVFTDGDIGIWGLADHGAVEQVARTLADPDRTPESLLAVARRR
jgi:Methyltransferase domain